MEIRIKLYGDLKGIAPDQGREFTLSLPSGAGLEELYLRLQIPPDLLHTLLINGRRPESNAILTDEDVVVIFPQLCGG